MTPPTQPPIDFYVKFMEFDTTLLRAQTVKLYTVPMSGEVFLSTLSQCTTHYGMTIDFLSKTCLEVTPLKFTQNDLQTTTFQPHHYMAVYPSIIVNQPFLLVSARNHRHSVNNMYIIHNDHSFHINTI